jgi:cardiolipin synthase
MLQHLKTIPNQLTALRLLLIPILWVFAFLDLPSYVAVGLIITLLTDALDGPIARWLNQVTEFGSKLDSLADNLLTLSAVIWLLMLRPVILADHPVAYLATVAAYVSTLLLGWMKFRRFANLHLYSTKAAGLIAYIFAIHALLFGRYNEVLFFAAIGMGILSSLETLLLQLTRSQVDEHIGSILLVTRRRDPGS